MKNSLLLLLICFLPSLSLAQTTKPATFIIRGFIIDSVSKKPISYATAGVEDATTKQPVKSTLTKDDGSFALKVTGGKTYRLIIAFVGYKTRIIPLKMGSDNIDAGNINLSPSTKQLKEVSVTAMRPVVKQEIDRISYDVQADPETKTQTVLDMLRKVPLITVDASDNIQLKGSGNYKILINGKPSSLVAHNPSDVFKSMPASNIERIEVITTPPAKYDAEGLAGILNIITKKKIDQGYNGSVNVRENSVYGPGAGGSFTLKAGKFGLSSYVGVGDRAKQTSTTANTLETFAPLTNLQQSGANSNSGKYIYSSFELSYELDSLNLITASFDYYHNKSNSGNTQMSQLFDGSGLLTQNYNLINDGTSSYTGTDLGINYQLGFKRNKQQLLTASYKFSNSPNDQFNNISIINRLNYGQPDYTQTNNAGTKEQTAQIDYVHPLKKLNIEGGVKGIFRSNTSNFQTANQDSSGAYRVVPENTNNFNYEQNVYSFYNTYQYTAGDWGIKAGVRVEHTTINADFLSVGAAVDNGYSNVIPSISVQRKLKNNASFTFGFTNRIQRPDISELNPFVDRTNPKFISTGNPDLQPVLNHSFELNYSKFSKGSFNIGLNYSFADNTIQNITRLQDTVTFTTYQNVGSDKSLAANINVSYPLTKKITLNVNGRISQVWLKGYVNGQLYTNQGVQGYTFGYVGYKFADTWRAGANAGFYTSNILLQGKSNASVFNSYSVQKDIFNKKGTIFVNVSNPESQYRSSKSYTRDPAFYQSNQTNYPYRTFNIGFNYRFGKLKADIKKNQRGINNDDTKGKTTGANQ
jgi:hypothetical protein